MFSSFSAKTAGFSAFLMAYSISDIILALTPKLLLINFKKLKLCFDVEKTDRKNVFKNFVNLPLFSEFTALFAITLFKLRKRQQGSVGAEFKVQKAQSFS